MEQFTAVDALSRVQSGSQNVEGPAHLLRLKSKCRPMVDVHYTQNDRQLIRDYVQFSRPAVPCLKNTKTSISPNKINSVHGQCLLWWPQRHRMTSRAEANIILCYTVANKKNQRQQGHITAAALCQKITSYPRVKESVQKNCFMRCWITSKNMKCSQ